MAQIAYFFGVITRPKCSPPSRGCARTQPYHAIYIRALEDPTLVIRRTLRRQLPDANLPQDSSLVDFLAAVTHTLGQPLVIVLDQFEEFFIRLSPQFRAVFISELGALYDATDVPVKLLFSLREDWLASMDEIEARIPDLFRTRMRVSRLTETQALQAITGPVKQLGISYEPALLERLLADLLGSNQEVMPPQLQLICSALYDGRREEDRVLKIATYERLGGVQGVLHRYLEEELNRLDPIEQALARAILEELVTSEKTKAVKSSAELALALEVKLRLLVPLLEWLVRRRLLRVLKQETGHRAYELAHEYLIHEISLTADSQARKQAEELLQQEVENWQRFGTVLAADKLALIGDVRDVLRLNDDAQALLLNSALQVGQDIEYWLNRVPEPTHRVELLTKATQNKLTIVRQRAAKTLGSQDMPQSVAPLLTLALHDANMDVRDTASQSLAQLTTQHIDILERLKHEVERSAQAENPTASTRTAVLRTLTHLPLSNLPLTLRIQVLTMRIRLYVTWLIKLGTTTPQGRAVILTSGLFIAVAAITYTFAANSYYVSLAAPDIRDTPINITISQGRPWLPPMGLEQEWVDTGISITQIEEAQRLKVSNEELEGFWMDPDEGNYRQWAKDVTEVLKVEDAASILWYLGEKEEAFQMLIEEITNPQDSISQMEALSALRQILPIYPELVKPQHIDQLIAGLSHQDSKIVSSAIFSLEEVLAVNPQLTQSENTNKLVDKSVDLLSNSNSDIAFSEIFSLGRMLAGNPQLTQAHIKQLFELLSNSSTRHEAGNVLGEVFASHPDLAQPHIQQLLKLLSNSSTRYKVTDVLEEAFMGNPELAQPHIEQLLKLLSNSSISFQIGHTLREVFADNPQLAEQHIEQLIDLLSHQDSYVASTAASSLGEVLAVNPQLAQQHIDQLFNLLSHQDLYIASNVIFSLEEVLAVNPQLAQPQNTKQLVDKLVNLLSNLDSDSDSDSGFSAISSLGRVLGGNPQLAQSQHVKQLAEQLVDLLSNPKPNIEAYAVTRSLEALLAGNPELAQLHLDQLINLLYDQNTDIAFNAASIVEELLVANPELAKTPHIEQLIAQLSNSNSLLFDAIAELLAANPELAQRHFDKLVNMISVSDPSRNSEAAYALGEVLVANPKLVQPQHIEKLVNLLLYPHFFGEGLATLVGKIVTIDSSYTSQETLDSLRKQLENSQTHSGAVLVLAHVYIHEDPHILLEKLTDPRNTLERPVAARALFLKALQEPSKGAEISQALQKLSNSKEPMERIWANKTLAMLNLASEAHAAAELEGEQREEATKTLRTLCRWKEWWPNVNLCKPIDTNPFDEEPPNFSGKEFTWAVREAMTWLWEQGNEENARTVAK